MMFLAKKKKKKKKKKPYSGLQNDIITRITIIFDFIGQFVRRRQSDCPPKCIKFLNSEHRLLNLILLNLIVR